MKLFIPAALAAVALSASTASAAFPSTVMALLDTKADPCEDFYQYTCGSWVKNTIINASETSVAYSFSTIGDRNDIVVQEILKEDWPLVGEFWDSCMNLDKLNELGAKPLHKTLREISAIASKSDVFKLAGRISKTGPNIFTGLSVHEDMKNTTTNVLYVSAGEVTLPSASYLKNSFAKVEPAYRTYISTILRLAGFKALDPVVAQNAVINIEKKLAEMMPDAKTAMDPDKSYNSIKFGDAATKYPLAFGQIIAGLGLDKHPKLTKSTHVVFETLEYFDKFEAMLKDVALTDLQIYVAFAYTSHYARYLSKPFTQARFEFFSKALNGVETPTARNKICVAHETTVFPDLIGKYYFLKMFDTQREDATKLIVKLVEDVMAERIKKLSWLDAATKAEAAKKLAKMSNLIGHSLEKKSYPYTLARDAFFDNIEKINADRFESIAKTLGSSPSHAEWGDTGAATVNAYYAPLKNRMMFPAGILQPPFFNGSSHPAQNFGAIGMVIGHELTHGFDSNGRLYSSDGNRKDWWTPATSAEFDARAQCLREQYSSFVVRSENGSALMNVDGNLTITENIADNGGLSLAYDAYQKYIKSSQAVVPPGTQLSEAEANQLFFIAFGQAFCSKKRDSAMKQQLTTDVHSPGQWRINGVAMNSDEFTKAFQCKPNAKMNPAKKCKIW